MSTDAVTSSGLRSLEDYQKKSSSGKASNLDMDDFLKLFVAQLSYQDPLGGSSGSSGGGGTDYISQMAQLTMLEQFSALNDSLSVNQAYGMIGKYVYLGDGTQKGIVDGVISEGGEFYLLVAGQYYSVSDVYAVVDGDSFAGATEDQILQSANLIGKTVTAIVTEDGEETTITGKVDKVVVEDGLIYLMIDDQKISFYDIKEISAMDADE